MNNTNQCVSLEKIFLFKHFPIQYKTITYTCSQRHLLCTVSTFRVRTRSKQFGVNILINDEVGVGFILQNVLLHDVMYELKLLLKLVIHISIMTS